MQQNVTEKLIEIIKEILEFEGEIKENANLVEELEIDSVVILQLIANIEMKFDITFDDEDLMVDKFETVASLAQYIEELILQN